MSKIICEICGTVYPDNATQCPICGYPRSPVETTESTQTEAADTAARTYQKVKGGRYSNSNVKKRNNAAKAEELAKTHRAVEQEPEELDEPDEQEQPKAKSNRGLVITVVILLAAVICVGAYIGIRFFRGADAYDQAPETIAVPETTVAEETEPDLSCTEISIADLSLTDGVEFQGAGRGWKLNVTTTPAETSDVLMVSSSDESVVTASLVGNEIDLLSVAPGSATITVTCGSVSVQFPVNCNFEVEETTEATEETTADTEETTEVTQASQGGTWSLNYTDVTIAVDESFTLKLTNEAGESASVSWYTGSESITVSGNTVTGVATDDYNEVSCTYNGQKYICIVRVK